MPVEIERKFLVKGSKWKKLARDCKLYIQGYMCIQKNYSIRVRTIEIKGYLTIKGNRKGISRVELEYEIPIADAETMLNKFCAYHKIEKIRYRIPVGNMIWEIDEYKGKNRGLVVAEIELNDINQSFELPEWIDKEVTDKPKYLNENLAKLPFSKWK